MGKVAKLLPPEDAAIAEKNGIPLVTVYKRLQRGWDVEKAITKPTRSKGNQARDDRGEYQPKSETGKKGKIWSFAMPEEFDPMLSSAIADSELTQTDFLTEIVTKELRKRKKSQTLKQQTGKKGRAWSFTMPEKFDEKLETAIAKSGLTQTNFLAQIVIKELSKKRGRKR